MIKEIEKNMEILIVEQEITRQILLSEIVEYLGHTPCVVTNGKKALTLAHSKKFTYAFVSETIEDYPSEIISHILKKNNMQIIVSQSIGKMYHRSIPYDFYLDWISIRAISQILSNTSPTIDYKSL